MQFLIDLIAKDFRLRNEFDRNITRARSTDKQSAVIENAANQSLCECDTFNF